MKKIIIVVVIVGMVGFAVFDFVNKSNNTAIPETDQTENNVEESDQKGDSVVRKKTEGLNVGNLAPDFELTTLEGDTVKLSDYRGDRVMLNFWATWCAPCRAEMPDMQKFHENTDIVILAVNLTKSKVGEAEKVPGFIDDFGITFNILMDVENDVAGLYQIQPIPTNYMINTNGVIHNMAYGALNYDLMIQEYEKMN